MRPLDEAPNFLLRRFRSNGQENKAVIDDRISRERPVVIAVAHIARAARIGFQAERRSQR
jgi:hypothetical protein